jgi:hypothetical protein
MERGTTQTTQSGAVATAVAVVAAAAGGFDTPFGGVASSDDCNAAKSASVNNTQGYDIQTHHKILRRG